MVTLDELLEGGVELDSGNVLRVHELGHLALPTGELIARDPLAGSDAPSFLLAIPPGTYAVSLRVIQTPNAPATREYFDVAALVLRLGAGPCASWDIALTDEDPKKHELRAGEYPGFMVDSANAAFLDASLQPELDHEEVRERIRAAHRPPGGGMVTLGSSVADIAFCSSGAGDGVYPAFVGFDASGVALAVVIDFAMIPIARPELLTAAQLDARVEEAARDLGDPSPTTVRAAMREAVALGARARPLVPHLERFVTAVPGAGDTWTTGLRDQAARALGELDEALGLRATYHEIVRSGAPADRLELALTVVARLDWPASAMLVLGASAAGVSSMATASTSTILAAVRCIDLFGIADVQTWTRLATYRDSAVRVALLDACARNYRAERAAAYNEDEREYRKQRVTMETLDAVVLIGMSDANPEVRAAAANALGVSVSENPALRTALVPAIEDTDPRVVLAATQHLTFRKDLEPDLVARIQVALQKIVDAGERAYAQKASSALRRLSVPRQ